MSRLKKTMSGHSWREFLKVCGTCPGRHSGRTIDTARGRERSRSAVGCVREGKGRARGRKSGGGIWEWGRRRCGFLGTAHKVTRACRGGVVSLFREWAR